VIELVPDDEPQEARAARAERQVWLAERDYAVIEITTKEAQADMGGTLDRLMLAVQKC
jgi:very-short-patch-repair endonuclease